MEDNFDIITIGYVRIEEDKTWIELKEELTDGLLRLDEFSHLITIWWISGKNTAEDRNKLQYHPQLKKAEKHLDIKTPLCGVFATRSPGRPNPIGLTIVKIIRIEENKIFIDRHDAFDKTPVLDLKPYIPKSDSIINVTVPDFFSVLSEKRID